VSVSDHLLTVIRQGHPWTDDIDPGTPLPSWPEQAWSQATPILWRIRWVRCQPAALPKKGAKMKIAN